MLKIFSYVDVHADHVVASQVKERAREMLLAEQKAGRSTRRWPRRKELLRKDIYGFCGPREYPATHT